MSALHPFGPADLTPCSASVSYGKVDDIGVLVMDNPPVNGLGDTVRAGLWEGLKRAQDDASIHAIVIVGAGKMFSGGADIRQFNTPAALAEPTSRQVARRIESSSKPVVAAIHGMALGGGLELALACHYRLATANAQLGLPEVNLGLLPGGGGTQRLPRLLGTATALSMIVDGRPISGDKALKAGLVDALIEGERVDSAVAYAKNLVAQKLTHFASVREREALALADDALDAVLSKINPKARNVLAQRAAADCVVAAARLQFDAGLDYERNTFEALVAGPESKALRHIFFAERGAAKVDGLTQDTQAQEIKKAGIVGAGTMGGGIAMAFVNAGIPVVLFEREQAALDRGLALIRKNYEITAKKGKLSAAQVEERMARITPTLAMTDLSDVDLVIEAVFEEMAVKQAVFEQLDRVCKPGAILATNTSRLDINVIAQATKRPEDVIGLHFFSPANVMKLLEVVRGEKTSDTVIATSMRVAQKIGKVPVLVGVCEGFVGNRMLSPYWREAWFLLEEGATPQQIDNALTTFGMAMGPLTMGDMAGLDINWAARKRLAPTRPKDQRYSKVPDRICELGRFGQKTGAGFYHYEKGSRTPVPDPVVDALIAEVASESGITRRTITDEEIVERCMLALVNEGARIVDEGFAQRAADIDVVYVDGYGFPATRGGPMFYAQTLGLNAVNEKLKALEARHGKHWTPAPLIARLAAARKTTFAG